MEEQVDRKLVAVVFTDIVGFSALTQKSESQAIDVVSRYRRIVIDCTGKFRGHVAHFYGDGSLTYHQSAFEAVQCALEMQAGFLEEPGIPVRVGVHFGEVVFTRDNIYGNAVNIASRIQNLSDARMILVSGTVARELSNHPEITTLYIGKEYVKNISEAVSIYCIQDDGLRVPTKGELHLRNKAGGIKYAASLMAAFLIVILAALWLVSGTGVATDRILVEKFSNETGEATFDSIASFSRFYLSQYLKLNDNVEVVDFTDIENDVFSRQGLMDLPLLRKWFKSDYIIDGEFDYQADGLINIRCNIRSSFWNRILQQISINDVEEQNVVGGLWDASEKISTFFVADTITPLIYPNEEAFRVYIEAIKQWDPRGNFEENWKYISKSIELDSSFVDGYYQLADLYYSIGEFGLVDSLLDVIDRRFPVYKRSERHNNVADYYRAMSEGDYPRAYKHLLIEYNRDPKLLINNTTTALFALSKLNEPERALKILRKIPFRKLDYTHPDNVERLNIGVRAHCATGNYDKAARLMRYYPDRNIGFKELKLKMRVRSFYRDTAEINKILLEVGMNYEPYRLISGNYWVSEQFKLIGEKELARLYAQRALDAAVQLNESNYEEILAAYDLGKYRYGLDIALKWYGFRDDYPFYVAEVARGYAYLQMNDSIDYYHQRLAALRDTDPWLGRVSYCEASLYTTMGQHDKALVKLRTALNEGYMFLYNRVQYDAQLMPLFGYEDWDRIIHPMRN